MGRSIASMRRSIRNAGKPPGAKRAHHAAIIDSQNAKSAEKAPSIHPPGFHAGKKIKGKSDISSSTRKASDARPRPRRRYSRSRRRGAGDGHAVRDVSFPPELYPRGLSGAGVQRSLKKSLARVNLEIVKRSDHVKASSSCQSWIVEPTSAWLGRSKTRQGFGEPHAQRARLPAPRLNPAHVAKTMQSRMMFPDKLLRMTYLRSRTRMISLSSAPRSTVWRNRWRSATSTPL